MIELSTCRGLLVLCALTGNVAWATDSNVSPRVSILLEASLVTNSAAFAQPSAGNTERGFEYTKLSRDVAARTAEASKPLPEPANPLAVLRYRDQQPLVNRLRHLQALPVLTLWDSGVATLYVGVNRDGDPGLHLRQKRDDRGSRIRNSLTRSEPQMLNAAQRAARNGPR